ncbi:MAG TPA: ABC transporter permease [Thermoanaerobaculia bacterium]|nr:ABC transporter permease [Thermoanaerobaculia bacterium]
MSRPSPGFSGLALDLRHAARSLTRQPGFTLAATVALALGIGASTATFSVLYSVALRPLPWPEADRVVALTEVFPEDPERQVRGRGGFSLTNVREWRERSETIDGISAYWPKIYTLTGDAEPVRVDGVRVSPDLFRILRVPVAAGRVFTHEEVEGGETMLAVLSQRAFRRHLAGDAARLGQPLRLDGEHFTVIGVMPAGFDFPDAETDLWVPLDWRALGLSDDPMEHREIALPVIGRLAQGVSLEQATDEGNRLLQALRGEREERMQQRIAAMEREGETGGGAPGMVIRRGPGPGADTGPGRPGERRMMTLGGRPQGVMQLESLQERTLEPFRPAIRVLAGAVLLVFLIACANVINLLLVRGVHRQRELATRSALGAGRAGLMRTLLAESLLLSICGGALGVLLAWAAVRLVVGLDPGRIPRMDEVALHPPVLWFALGLVLLSAFLFGTAPLLQVSLSRLGSLLGREGGPIAGKATVQSWVRGGLVVSETALALVLLIGAGLLSRSFLRLTAVDLGFDTNGVLTAYLATPAAKYPPGPARLQLHESLLEQVRALPGVRAAGMVNFLPPVAGRVVLTLNVEGRPQPENPEEVPSADLRVATPGYLAASGIPLLEGRDFDDRDRGERTSAVLLSESLAKELFPDESAVGRRLAQFGEIVGVVGDVRAQGYEQDVQPTFYLPLGQAPAMMAPIFDRMGLVVSADDPEAVAPGLRAALQTLDPELALDEVQTMEQRLAESVARPRFYAAVMGVFAVLALLLAVVGLYGVLSYVVTRRTRETGVRMALGAARSQVVGSAMWSGLRLVLLGVTLGVAGALALQRFVESLLYQVEPTDPATFVGLSAVLLATSVVASLLPARRAAAVDPVEALRHE